jgi:hypothetical protein
VLNAETFKPHRCCVFTKIIRVFVTLLTAALIFPAPAAENTATDLPKLKTTPRRIAVLKNGLGFVARSGDTKVQNGLAEIDSLPSASLGALWFTTDNPAHRILEISSAKTLEKVPVPAVNLIELIRANTGRVARVTYTPGGNAGPLIVSGEIIAVPEDRRAPEPAAGEMPRRHAWDGTPLPESARAEIVVLRNTAGQIVALNKHSIHSVQFDTAELATTLSRETTRARLRFNPRVQEAAVNLIYLQKGWNWTPSYLLDISNEKQAAITLEAVLANDIEDIENTEISFVVGYPNFTFADLFSPLSSEQTIAELIHSLLNPPQTSPGRAGYSIMAQNAVSYSGASVAATYSAAEFTAGQTAEDLFLYKQPAVTLAKGGRARFTLVDASVPYEHIYEWRISDKSIDRRFGGSMPNRDRLPEHENEVWHTLRLTNTTQQPWTTAPALTVRGQLPVAQDTLKYTPPGASSSLKITVASDIQANETLTELSREPVRHLNTTYMHVTVQGELMVRNLKSSPVKIAIHRSLAGEVLEPAGATVLRAGRAPHALNPSHELLWEVTLAPAQQSIITFKYTTLATQ